MSDFVIDTFPPIVSLCPLITIFISNVVMETDETESLLPPFKQRRRGSSRPNNADEIFRTESLDNPSSRATNHHSNFSYGSINGVRFSFFNFHSFFL